MPTQLGAKAPLIYLLGTTPFLPKFGSEVLRLSVQKKFTTPTLPRPAVALLGGQNKAMKKISPVYNVAVMALALGVVGLAATASAASQSDSAFVSKRTKTQMTVEQKRAMLTQLRGTKVERDVLPQVGKPATSAQRGGTPTYTVNQSTSPINTFLNLDGGTYISFLAGAATAPGYQYGYDEFGMTSDTTGNTLAFSAYINNRVIDPATDPGTIIVRQDIENDQIYVYDRTTGLYKIASRGSALGAGDAGQGEFGRFYTRYAYSHGSAKISGNGRYVTFASFATHARSFAGNNADFTQADRGYEVLRDNQGNPHPSADLAITQANVGVVGANKPIFPAVYRYDLQNERLQVVSTRKNQAGFANITLPATTGVFSGSFSTDISADGNTVFYIFANHPGAGTGEWNPTGVGADTLDAEDILKADEQYVWKAVFTPGSDVPATTLVSVTTAGKIPNDGAGDVNDIASVRCSGDGRYAAFVTNSDKMVDPLVTGVNVDIAQQVPILKDTVGGANGGNTARPDRSGTTYGNGTTWFFDINKGATGPYFLVFDTDSSNLNALTGANTPATPNGLSFNLLRSPADPNAVTGATTELVNKTTAGAIMTGDNTFPSQSPDGRYVAWFSTFDDPLLGDDNSDYDVYIRDFNTNTTRLWSLSPDSGAVGNFTPSGGALLADGDTFALISPDSSYKKYSTGEFDRLYFFPGVGTAAANPTSVDLVVADPTGVVGVFNAATYTNTVSPDGTKVAFTTFANNVPTDANNDSTINAADYDDNGNPDIYVKSLSPENSNYELVSKAFGGGFSGGATGAYTTVVFPFGATDGAVPGNLVPNRADSDTSGALPDQFFPISFSDDGTKLVYTSASIDLLDSGGAINELNENATSTADANFFDVYLYNLTTKTNSLVSLRADGTRAANGTSYFGKISGDGNWVIFQSDANNLGTDYLGTTLGGANTTEFVWRRNLVTGVNKPVSVKADGSFNQFGGVRPELNSNGLFAVFLSGDTTTYLGTAAGTPGQNGRRYLQTIRASLAANDTTIPTFTLVSQFRDAAASGVYFTGTQATFDNGGVAGGGTVASLTGRPSDFHTNNPRISPDGQKVLFDSCSDLTGVQDVTDLVDLRRRWHVDGVWNGSMLGNSSLYLWDAANPNTFTLVSAGPDGKKAYVINNAGAVAGRLGAGFSDFSGNNKVVYWSYAESLLETADPFNAILRNNEATGVFSQANLFSFDIASGVNTLVSTDDSGTLPLGTVVNENAGTIPTLLYSNISLDGTVHAATAADNDSDLDLTTNTTNFRAAYTFGIAGSTPTPVMGASSSWDLYSGETK